MNIFFASLLSPITLSFMAGMFAALVGFEIKLPKRALQAFSSALLFAIGVDGGRGLAGSELRGLAAGLAVTASLILLLPALSYLIARYVTRFSAADSAALATLYGSVSSAVLMAAYAESGDMNLGVDGLVMGLASLMELGMLVALLIGTLALRRQTDTASAKRASIGGIGGAGFLLLLFGLLVGWWIGDRFGQSETIIDVMLTGTLMVFMVEMGMVTAGAVRKLRATAVRTVSFALLMPAVGGFLGTWIATLAGMSDGSAFVLGAAAASASFISAPPLVRAAFPTADPSIYLTCALGVTFPVLLLVGLPLLAQLASWL